MVLFDAHAHYNDSRFDTEYDGGAVKAIKDALEGRIVGFLNAGTDPETSRLSVDMANTYNGVYAAVGLHPEDCEDYRDSIADALACIERLAGQDKAVAIGEIGLDYHWNIDKKIQKDVFDSQLSMAGQLGLPVCIHDRDAHGDTLDIIKCHRNVIGMMHGYSGSAETAREYLNMGWYISFGGPVTYKNAQRVRDAMCTVPSDRLLIETDCPYLPPVPFRGKLNHSLYMFYTLESMAQTRNENIEKLAESTVSNAERLFEITLPRP